MPPQSTPLQTALQHFVFSVFACEHLLYIYILILKKQLFESYAKKAMCTQVGFG